MFLDFDNATAPKVSPPRTASPTRRVRTARSVSANASRRQLRADAEFHALVASVLDEEDGSGRWFEDDQFEVVAASDALGISSGRFELVLHDLSDSDT